MTIRAQSAEMSRKSSGSAAWLAHLVWDQRVAGSNPARSTRIRATLCIASEGLRRKVWGNRLLFELTALPCKRERKGSARTLRSLCRFRGLSTRTSFPRSNRPKSSYFSGFRRFSANSQRFLSQISAICAGCGSIAKYGAGLSPPNNPNCAVLICGGIKTRRKNLLAPPISAQSRRQ